MRILGIDLGTTSIKAMEIDSAFGRFEIHEYHELAVPSPTERASVAAELLRSLSKKPDRIVVGLPTRETTFRNLQLPTKDKKSIQAGIGFELEDELPFALENAAYDYCVLGQTRSSSQVHVAATLTKRMAALLSELSSAGIDPDLVTTEAWAYRGLMNRIGASPTTAETKEPPVILAHLGHSRSVLYAHHGGTPVFAREIAWGGLDLTAAIARRYQIPSDQAETAKLNHGFVIPASQLAEATAEQVELSGALMEPLEGLLRDIRQAELSCKSSTQSTPSVIYLTGGTSLLPGLARVIEEELKIPVRPLRCLSSVAASGVTYSEQTDVKFALATSLALCMVGPDRNLVVNFRKGGFGKQGRQAEMNLSALRRPILSVASVVGCLLLSLSIESSVYQSRLKELDTSLDRNIRSFFGTGLSSGAVSSYKRDTSLLRKNIKLELAKQRELAQLFGPNPRQPIDLLRELSIAIPKDTVTDLLEYQVGAAPAQPMEPTAKLTFSVPSQKMSDRLASELAPKLKDMTKTPLEEIPSDKPGGEKKFKITFSGRPTEAAYGR